MNNKEELINELQKLQDDASLSELQKVTSKFLGKKIWISPIGRSFFVWAILLAIITLLFITDTFNFGKSKVFDMIAYASWTIIPPAWFMFEYTWLFPDDARFDSNQLADLKYKHELAGKIWGGLVILITAIMFEKYK